MIVVAMVELLIVLLSMAVLFMVVWLRAASLLLMKSSSTWSTTLATSLFWPILPGLALPWPPGKAKLWLWSAWLWPPRDFLKTGESAETRGRLAEREGARGGAVGARGARGGLVEVEGSEGREASRISECTASVWSMVSEW